MKRLIVWVVLFTSMISSIVFAVPTLFAPVPESGDYFKGGINQFSINVTEAGLNTTNVSLSIKAQADTDPGAWDRHSLTCQNYTASDWFCTKNVSLLIAGDDTVEVFFFTASDNFGNQGSFGTASSPLNFTLDVNPPRVQSINLQNSTHVGINQSVEMNVFDSSSGVNTSRVFFRYGNSTFNSSWEQMAYSAPLFKYNWTTLSLVTNGTYSVYFNATDNIGNRNTSKILDVPVDNELPSLTINLPTSGKTLFDTANLSVTVTDIYAGVDNTSATYSIGNVNGTLSCGGAKSSNNCTGTLDSTKLSDGTYTMTFTASDLAGNQNSASTQVQVNNTKVTITINNPSSGSYVSGTVPINATLNNIGPGISKLQLRWENTTSTGNWENMTCDVSYNCGYTWDTTSFAETTYTFRLNITGTLAYIVEKTFVVNVDNTKPLITIQSPTERQVSGTITPSAIILDGSGVQESNVKFNISTYSQAMSCTSFEGGKRLSCGGSFDTTNLQDGTYTLYFLASDLAGNQNIETVQLSVYNLNDTTTTTTTTTVVTPPQEVIETPKEEAQVGMVRGIISKITNTVKSPLSIFVIFVFIVAVGIYVYLKRRTPWKTSYQ